MHTSTLPRRMARRTRLHTTAEALAVAPTVSPAPQVVDRRGAKILAAAGALVLIAWLVLLFGTDWFFVEDLELNGAQFLTKPEIMRASSILSYSIFFVDATSVQKSIERLPEVKSASVGTGLPNRVVVDVVERQPWLTWKRGTETYWVDDAGIAFAARVTLADLPVLVDRDAAAIKPGEPVSTKTFKAYRALRDAWSDSPRVLEWTGARGIAATNEYGWKIYFGDASDMAGKVAEMRALVTWLRERNVKVQFIDLGQGDPFYR
jgi:cell division septal protein FtsQ